ALPGGAPTGARRWIESRAHARPPAGTACGRGRILLGVDCVDDIPGRKCAAVRLRSWARRIVAINGPPSGSSRRSVVLRDRTRYAGAKNAVKRSSPGKRNETTLRPSRARYEFV